MQNQQLKINKNKTENLILEIKLTVNQKLYESEKISRDMYLKAKEVILRS